MFAKKVCASRWVWTIVAVAAVGFMVTNVAVALDEEKPKAEPKKEAAKPPFPIPDIEKLLPQGLDPDQIKVIKEQIKKAQEDARKAIEELQKQFPGGFPGGIPGGGMFPGGFRPGFPFGGVNRLGVAMTRPSDTLVDQLDLPKDQGLVLNNMKPDSAAAKAGLKNNDILLELGGKKVSNQIHEFTKVLNDYKTGDKVDVVVLRKGKKETVKDVTLPEVPKNAMPGFQFQIPGNVPNIQIIPGGKLKIQIQQQ
jgi:membrane-associated protease RseP (regulator of RpoE activity)